MLLDDKVCFLITIDTEGDNLWSQPKELTTHNAEFLPRFQSLCEKYGLKPTYVTNYEMAMTKSFQNLGKDIIKRQVGEIGMHLHAWDSPPEYKLTSDDQKNQPYLIEYPYEMMYEKIKYITDVLEDIFEEKMVSHRAGRWAFNEIYARILEERGYLVDCSVTPLTSWGKYLGDPSGLGGTDYRHFPNQSYFLDLDDISKPGNSKLLEVPLTVVIPRKFKGERIKSFLDQSTLGKKFSHRLFPVCRFRPTGQNFTTMQNIMQFVLSEKIPYIEFMLHSSEFMPGGSPLFPDEESIEKLYQDLELLFNEAKDKFVGATLKEFYNFNLRQL